MCFAALIRRDLATCLVEGGIVRLGVCDCSITVVESTERLGNQNCSGIVESEIQVLGAG